MYIVFINIYLILLSTQVYIYCHVFYNKLWKNFTQLFTDEYSIIVQGVV